MSPRSHNEPPMHTPLIIGGEKIAQGSESAIETYDPATNEVIATVAQAGTAEVDQAVESARRAFDSRVWCGLKPVERGRMLLAVAHKIMERQDEIARLEVVDGGKPLRDALGEVALTARFFEYYGGYADKVQGTSVPLGDGWMDWTIREAIGVSAQIVPWNYSIGVAARGVAPALAAGCSVVIKPSTETPLAISVLAEICHDVGIPAGVVNVIHGRGSVVGNHLARHSGVDQITFTGSEATGQQIMEAAAVRSIPVTLELGGKSPMVVFDDADIDVTVSNLITGMWAHAGQVCNAGTRLIASDQILDEVVYRLQSSISEWSLGHGLDNPDMGPLVSRQQKTNVLEYYAWAESNAEVLYGGSLPEEGKLVDGNFVRPAIVTGVDNNSRIAQEEVFGPLLTAMPFHDIDEAIEMANASNYGLVAGVYTTDISKAMRAAERLRAGQIWINSFYAGLDVEFPFGGYKRSGFGREKGIEGINAYLQVKNVCIKF